MLGEIVRVLLLTAELALAVPLAYLLVLSIAALVAERHLRRRARLPAADDGRALPHIAILIPAHDEEAMIALAIQSCRALDYPAERFATIVVADNCDDATAPAARRAGALVFERRSAGERAKGYALRWLLERLEAEGRCFDGYLIVDADSQLSPNVLREMAAALAGGALVAQAQYRVLNGDDAWTAGLRAVAIALFNHLRPLGRTCFGWSAGLKGNGMCFSRAVFERFGWGSYSLAEDAEYHIQLISAGIRVAYVPAALVSAEMPVSLGQARTQQARWERGRIELARAWVGPLVRGFLRTGDLARLDVAMEIVLPPLSLVVAAVAGCTALAALLRWAPGLWLALGLCVALSLHVLIGAALARLSARAYLALLRAPLFIAWKCWVYGAALLGRRSGPWVRTERVEVNRNT